jgi:hypothetical protein
MRKVGVREGEDSNGLWHGTRSISGRTAIVKATTTFRESAIALHVRAIYPL